MHIPDGYLSPSTCITLYAAAAPFWHAALKRVGKALDTRMIPLLSVFSAFSFVIMMFNLPLPGGTTGHAVGMGLATIVLGPWASIVAISVALLIQAVFFGDGGITTIGANCFNMAIVGSLVAYAVYRIVCRGAPIGSARRVIGAGIAGYAAINVAALFTAVEFGLQPLLFHDASGAPLYAPYPLSVAIPAMMIGHLTFAGLAELVISAGIVAYLQKADPELLRFTAPDAPDSGQPVQPWITARKLWLALAALVILTPLGILAAGSAWGEAKISSLWAAPAADYAPPFIRNASLGYFVSAVVGVGLILLFGVLLRRFLFHRRHTSFVERTIHSLLEAVRHALFAEEMAQSDGLLQRLDARVKLVGLGALIVAAVSVHQLAVLSGVFVFAILLALLSHVPIRLLAVRVWAAVLAFTGLIALPAIFLTPGAVIYRLPLLHWSVTDQGLRGAAFLVLRAETAATLSVLLILCTLWTHLLRALRFFHLPVVVVVILGMTYRYIFLFLETARDMFESRQARLVGILEPAERRRLAGASAGVLLGKSLQLSGEVHMAMRARGFRGEVRLLDDLRMRSHDWLRLAALVGIACIAVWLGR